MLTLNISQAERTDKYRRCRLLVHPMRIYSLFWTTILWAVVFLKVHWTSSFRCTSGNVGFSSRSSEAESSLPVFLMRHASCIGLVLGVSETRVGYVAILLVMIHPVSEARQTRRCNRRATSFARHPLCVSDRIWRLTSQCSAISTMYLASMLHHVAVLPIC